jgi:hypothetical protein
MEVSPKTMPSQQSEIKSAIRLPSVLAIGFTGHRSLPDEAKSRESIRGFLREQKAKTSAIVYGVSSAAAGSDLLFAESCLELEIPLRILLPLPREEFRKDFDPATWLRAEAVMSKAVSVVVTGDREIRNQAYYECGVETVQQSQLMIALWDGEPSRGMGGTQEIKEFAEKMDKPVIWIHSTTGATQVLNEPALRELEKLQDTELEFLNGLPDAGVTLSSDSRTALAEAWLNKADKNASKLAPQVRRLSSIPIAYTAAAAFFTGAGLKMQHPETWLAIGSGLGVTAIALPFLLRLDQRQILWARTRTAAEVCRSVLALWAAPVQDEVIGAEIIPELAGTMRSLNLLKALDSSTNAASLDDFKARYRKERVRDQIDYFSRNAERSARRGKKYRNFSLVCIGLAIVIAMLVFVIGTAFKQASMVLVKNWLSVAISALFQLATIAGALLIVHDCERRQRRYREFQNWLEQWDAELVNLRTWPTVLKVVVRIERALLVELLEWKSLVRNAKMPRK